MSFNATNSTGIAEPIQVTDFLQFIPSIGAGIGVGLGSLITSVVGNKGITFATPIIKAETKPLFSGLKLPTFSGKIFSKSNPLFSKTNVLTGGAFGITALGTSFLQTPEGQNTLSTTENITDFITKNPIVPIALIGLVALLAVGAMKK